MRSTGVVRSRVRGGLTGFASEDFYIHASRFQVDTADLAKRLGIAPPAVKVLFRRLYVTNSPVIHMDIGLRVNSGDKPEILEDVRKVTEALLNASVSIKGMQAKIGVASKLIADHYLRNSTPKDAETPKGAVEAFRPTIVFESMPGGPDWVKLVQLHDSKGSTPVWIVSPRLDRAIAQSRALRLTLIRLRSEREALRSVLNAADRGVLKFEARTPGGDKLSRYLDRADSLFKGQVPDELVKFMDKAEYQKVLDVALSTDQLFQPGAVERLHIAFDDLRPNLLRKLKGWSASDEKRMELVEAAQGIPVSHLELNMNEKNISVSQSTGVAIVAGDGDATATVTQTSGTDLKALLDLLNQQVAEAAKQLPPAEAKKVEELAEEVKSVVTSDKPVQKWYDVSAEGLKDAAKAVAGIVPDIAGTLLKIGKLVFGG